jgi:hypothetical protein
MKCHGVIYEIVDRQRLPNGSTRHFEFKCVSTQFNNS